MSEIEIRGPFKFLNSKGEISMEIDPHGFGKVVPVGDIPQIIEKLNAGNSFKAAADLYGALYSPRILCGHPEDPLPLIGDITNS